MKAGDGMGQIIDNGINNLLNVYKESDKKVSQKAYDVNSYESIPHEDEVLGYRYNKENNPKVDKTTADNFEEYLRNRQEKAKEAGTDEATAEKEDKENQKDIARSLSDEEIRKLRMMGVDIEGAKLSDLMSMVNTMRQNVHADKMQEIMGDAMFDEDNVSDVITGSNAVYSAGTKIKMDITDALYLVRNNLPANEDNIYKAKFSGTKLADEALSEDVMKNMQPQLEKIIEQCGLNLDDENLQLAKLMVNNDVPVTTDTFRMFRQYVNGEIDLTDNIDVRAQKLMNDIDSISPEMVYDMAKDGKEVTIASALNYQGIIGEISDENLVNNSVSKSSVNVDDSVSELSVNVDDSVNDLKAITAKRQIEEIRLTMTLESSKRMLSLDINIDTRELSQVVSTLRNCEKQMLGRAFKNEGVDATATNVTLYSEMSAKLTTISKAPATVLATPLINNTFSINSLYEASIDGTFTDKVPANFERVLQSYDSVKTAPRSDMGDSISKAFGNIEQMLGEMNVEADYESIRAVKILGYNQLEITPDNINSIIDYDRQVNELMTNLYPEAVLGLIKDNVNPMDVSIDELNKTLRKRNYNKGVTEASNFASFLRDMEKKGEISDKERESYIGIYRMMDKLSKSQDREAGWLFASGERLTINNLLKAMRSRKAKSMDFVADDDTGLSDVNIMGNRIDSQIRAAFDATGAEIGDKIGGEFDLADTKTGDEFDATGGEIRAAFGENFDEVADEVESFMEANSIEFSIINTFAVKEMLGTKGGIFEAATNIMSMLKFDADYKDDLIDEETDNMTDSLMGEEVSINPFEFETDSILESLRGSSEMSLRYDDLSNQITNAMYQLASMGTINSKDISMFKTVNAGFNIMRDMAKEKRYQIPINTKSGLNVINLSIAHDATKKGDVSISIRDTAIGNISASFSVKTTMITGEIVSDNSEGNYILSQNKSVLVEAMTSFGFDMSEVSFGQVTFTSEDLSDKMAANEIASEANPNEKMMYDFAVSFIKSLQGRLINDIF